MHGSYFSYFFCKSNAHENWQKSGKTEANILLDSITPFDRSLQNMEETYFQSSLISYNNRDTNFQTRDRLLVCRDIENSITSLFFEINDDYIRVFSIFRRGLSNSSIKSNEMHGLFFSIFADFHGHSIGRLLFYRISSRHSIDLVEI